MYRGIAKYSPSYRKYCSLSKRSPFIYGQTSFTRLFDSERSEADLQLSSKLASSLNGIQLESPRAENRTLQLNDLHETTTTVDVPLPTANGGFTHTTASKAKISAANKGKIPWNKGKSRSEETRARIAAGVRAKNRERFLKKLEDLGMTEEEYEQQKKEGRRQKEAERRARRTEKGGYRPTEATKKKISKILKTKWANGEMPKRRIDKSKVRRGFKHSKETREKISAALRKRWAEDESYRNNMVVKSTKVNGHLETRKRISETLKAKWKDPEFRSKMLSKMQSRNGMTVKRDAEYRKKISDAMKKKWRDQSYREKTMSSIKKRAEEMAKLRPPKPLKSSRRKGDTVQLARVAKPRSPRKRRVARKVPKEIGENGEVLPSEAKKVKKKVKRKITKKTVTTPSKKKKKSKIPKEPDGSINRLRDERRDLYDLLYGDEDSNVAPKQPTSGIAAMLDLGDENLDNFDPYGLDDF